MTPLHPPRDLEADTTITADLILLHAPSVYDFRERDDVLFAYLSDSDSVNVTSIYEQYPLGFFAIRQRLRQSGLTAEIVNVAALMLSYPELDVDRLLSHLSAPVFGIDLHWMAHCHGSIELAKRVKAIHPDAVVIFGGISSTYFAAELIQYPCVDVVVRGFDTLVPVERLVQSVKAGDRDFSRIPNLVYLDEKRDIHNTGFTHKPVTDYNDVATDWSWYAKPRKDEREPRLILTLPNSGCAFDCCWCGGSRYSYRKIMGVEKTLVTKNERRIYEELRSLGDAARHTSIYALQCYSETKKRLHHYLDAVREFGYRSVHFEQYHLTPDATLKKMAQATNAYIMLSPESHDPVISRLAGRGNYTMREMEEWIPRALDAGIRGIMVWFFIGMPRQTPHSVRETVAYGVSLLEKYRGNRVLPLVCPMVPFLDPGCRLFEEPEQHGYTVFYRTLAQHRRAMVEPLWHRRLNYETQWLSRRDLQDVTYEAVDRLIEAKAQLGIFPASLSATLRALIAETQSLLGDMERNLDLDGSLTPDLRSAVQHYNRRILTYASDQIIPTERPFGGRWFDDYTVPPATLARCGVTTAVPA